MNKQLPIATFRISEDDLEGNSSVVEAYGEFTNKLCEFGEISRLLKEATKKLHDLLDEPLRSAGFVSHDKEWTLKDDNLEGLIIQVWSEPRQRGRRKPEVPTKHLAFE
jgi:hypothetical protein